MTGRRSNALRQVLEQEIVTGTISPGARLDEVSLAERFRVSRTPVREALNQLETLGLVELRPRRGAIVSTIGLKDIIEMFEVMSELEGMCGRLAALRMSRDERDALQQIHLSSGAFVEENEHDAYYAQNARFHEAIYRGSRNRFLAEETTRIRNRLAPYRRLQLRAQNRLRASFDEHEEIVSAIMDENAERAEKALSAHVSVQTGAFNDFIATLPWNLIDADTGREAKRSERKIAVI